MSSLFVGVTGRQLFGDTDGGIGYSIIWDSKWTTCNRYREIWVVIMKQQGYEIEKITLARGHISQQYAHPLPL
jgi:hypothetical protein